MQAILAKRACLPTGIDSLLGYYMIISPRPMIALKGILYEGGGQASQSTKKKEWLPATIATPFEMIQDIMK